MSWGDVWVCDDKKRPAIDGEGPQPPWILAGVLTRDEKSFIEAMQRLKNTRGAHPRRIDFYLQVHSPDVALPQNGAPSNALSFEGDGLWVSVDLTAADRHDGQRFVVFTHRVRSATMPRRPPEPKPGVRRPRATLALRGHASPGASALEWAYRGSPLH